MGMEIDQVKGREIYEKYIYMKGLFANMHEWDPLMPVFHNELYKHGYNIVYKHGLILDTEKYMIYKGNELLYKYIIGKEKQWTKYFASGDWYKEIEMIYDEVHNPTPKPAVVTRKPQTIEESIEEMAVNLFCENKPFCDEAREIVKMLGYGVMRTINEDKEDEQSFACEVYDYDKLHILVDRDTPLISISFDEQQVFNSVKYFYCPGKWEEVIHYIYENRYLIPEIERREKELNNRGRELANEIYLKLYDFNTNNPSKSMDRINFYKKELEKYGIKIDRKYESAYEMDYSSSTTDYYVYKNGELVFHQHDFDFKSSNIVFSDGQWLGELEKVLNIDARYTIVESTNSAADQMILAMKNRFESK